MYVEVSILPHSYPHLSVDQSTYKGSHLLLVEMEIVGALLTQRFIEW
jgi:hypothetical protein